ncbi:MAG: ABC transporter permease, partial [Actinobacteria bacterium]|nr:ABC transporter permease [Actinomycetota bacterium]
SALLQAFASVAFIGAVSFSLAFLALRGRVRRK